MKEYKEHVRPKNRPTDMRVHKEVTQLKQHKNLLLRIKVIDMFVRDST